MAIATVQLPDGRIADIEMPNGATEEDLQGFLSSQFGEQQQAAPQQAQAPQQESGFLEKAGQFAMGLPQALGNKAVGAVQTATSALGYGDSEFGKNLGREVEALKQRQAQLPGAERAGITTGEIATDLALTRGMGLARGGAAVALTQPLEDSSAGARVMEAGKDAAFSQAFGTGINLAGKAFGATKEGAKNIVSGIKARAPEELQAVGQQLKQKATDLYKAADEIGARFKPKAAVVISRKIGDAIKEGGPLFKANHGATMSVVGDIQDDIAKKGYNIGLAELDQYAQALKDVVRNNTDIAGKVNSDGYKALKAVNKIDDLFNNLPDKYLINPANRQAIAIKNQASKEYSTYRKFERISDLAEKAAGDPNKIKSIIYRFASNKKNLQGFSTAEIKSLKEAGDLNTAEGIFKMFGKFGLDKGTSVTFGNTFLPAAVATGAFAAGGAQASLGAVAVGTAARQAQKYLARGKLDEALKLIQSSGNPAKTVSQIPNSKFREKLMQQLIKTGGVAIAESN